MYGCEQLAVVQISAVKTQSTQALNWNHGSIHGGGDGMRISSRMERKLWRDATVPERIGESSQSVCSRDCKIWCTSRPRSKENLKVVVPRATNLISYTDLNMLDLSTRLVLIPRLPSFTLQNFRRPSSIREKFPLYGMCVHVCLRACMC